MMAHRSKSSPAWTKRLGSFVSLVALVQLLCLVGNTRLAVALTLDRSSGSLLEENLEIPLNSFKEDEDQEDQAYDEISEEPPQYALAQGEEHLHDEAGHAAADGHYEGQDGQEQHYEGDGQYDEQYYDAGEGHEGGYEPQHYEEGAYEEHHEGDQGQEVEAASQVVHQDSDGTVQAQEAAAATTTAAAAAAKKPKKGAKAKVKKLGKRMKKSRAGRAAANVLKRIKKRLPKKNSTAKAQAVDAHEPTQGHV
ncbi:hypothetical protein CSUI_010380 [Cystoisospora suis]|uniref:Uncharacterized protein n=1 Tax=Cystoisospora suis TaxID=483139 RepID=A0A2C6KGM3_9APIC|nr:hypothetical protein CSUI_010380 [Cystoisospora suis]